MSPFGFSALNGAWLFFLLIPLVVFYFLKLKRPMMKIPSLVLWQQVIDDQRVNSPFQKFKRNILLIIQLLLLLLAILAAMQPYYRGLSGQADRLPIMIDHSASMAALDKPGGVSRLDLAKQEVNDRIENLLRGQKICLVSFSDTAHMLTGFTDNKRVLRAALDNLRVEDVPSDMEDALRMVQALNRRTPFDSVLLYSDGNLPARTDFELSFTLDYQRLEKGGPNGGITAINARRAGEQEWEVFIQLEGSSDDPTPMQLILEQDGQTLERQPVSVSAESAERMSFRIDGTRATALTARLEPNSFDALKSDNTAFLRLPAIRPLTIYVQPGLNAFEQALAPIEGIEIADDPAAPRIDLAITPTWNPAFTNAGTLLLVNVLPPGVDAVLELEDKGSDIVDWNRHSPVLRYVNFTDLIVQDRSVYRPGNTISDLENLGYDVLVHGNTGPGLIRKESPNQLQYALLFDTERSTWPYRIGFPVFIANLVQETRHRLGINEVNSDRTGVLPRLTLAPETDFTVQFPDGGEKIFRTNASGLLTGVPALHVGAYRISSESMPPIEVGVGLLSASESDLHRIEELQFNELAVEKAEARSKSDRSLWVLLVLIGLMVLIAEWLLYQTPPGSLAWSRK